MVRTTTDDATDDEPEPEHAAAEYADDPSLTNFFSVVDAVTAEYDDDGCDPIADVGVLTPAGLAVKLAAEAIGFDTSAMVDFDGNDEVTIEFEPFQRNDVHSTPMQIVRLATIANDAAERTVRFRTGAGSARIYVEADRPTVDDFAEEDDN